MTKTNLKGLTLKELEEFAVSIGEARFRGKQLFEWLYTKEAQSFSEMTSLSKGFRLMLEDVAVIGQLTLIESKHSPSDGTTKFLFELQDGKRIESVLIPPRIAFSNPDAEIEEEQSRLTLCVSTQVGCPLDCAFCATASMGLLRNLTTGEIVDQILSVKKQTGKHITNLVYMGMGEPLMNYDNVMNSVEIISKGIGIAARRTTISTAGWVPKIYQMGEENRKVKLAVSLHALNDSLRSKLMPINDKYNLDELFGAITYYYKMTNIRVTFEYILFDGLNDREEDVRAIVKLSKRIPCKFNIIPFHSIQFTHPYGFGSELRPTPARRVDDFVEKLRQANITVFVRSSAGEDIDAACGQLAVQHERKPRSIPLPLSALSLEPAL